LPSIAGSGNPDCCTGGHSRAAGLRLTAIEKIIDAKTALAHGLINRVTAPEDLDAIFHQSESFKTFFRLVQEQGMKAALRNRAARYG